MNGIWFKVKIKEFLSNEKQYYKAMYFFILLCAKESPRYLTNLLDTSDITIDDSERFVVSTKSINQVLT